MEYTLDEHNIEIDEDGEEIWLSKDIISLFSLPEHNIRNIFEFPTYEVEIDLANPEEGIRKFESLRDEIDLVCPVAKQLGSTSSVEYGEGNVWRCITKGYEQVAFKCKGKHHERKCKVPNIKKLSHQ